ncbi:hypothetical protein [Pseudoalteromonas gelatinilytica]
MVKVLVLSLLTLFLVISLLTKNIEEEPRGHVFSQSAELELSESSYSYEFYSSKLDNLSNPMIAQDVEPTDNIFQKQQFTHQPIPSQGTNKFVENEKRLPKQVLPGVEFIETEEKPFFDGTNEGKYISVVPDISPLLVREEAPLLKQSNIALE